MRSQTARQTLAQAPMAAAAAAAAQGVMKKRGPHAVKVSPLLGTTSRRCI